MPHKAEVSKKIKEIISRTYDSIFTYSSICEKLQNADIHIVCKDVVSQKKIFVNELSAQLAIMGEEVVNEKNYTETLERSWINSINPSVQCEKDLINLCISAEWNASKDYDDLLKKEIEIGNDLFKVATTHRSMINQSLRKLEMLKKGIVNVA